MPIAIPVQKVNAGAAAATVTSGAFTPTSGATNYLIAMGAAGHATTNPNTITITDNTSGTLTWTQIIDHSYATGTNPRLRMTVWYAPVPTFSSSMTVTVASASATSVAVSISEWSGIDVATFTNQGFGDNAAGDPTVTLSAVAAGSAVYYAAYGVGAAAYNPATGYSELTDAAAISTSRSLVVGYDVSAPATTVNIVSINTHNTACAFEIKAATALIAIDISGQTRLGDMTANAGTTAAFDGTLVSVATSCAAKAIATGSDCYIGTRLAAPKRIYHIFVHGSSDQGFLAVQNVAMTLTFYGKSGSDPANSTDGTLLATTTFTDTAAEAYPHGYQVTDTNTYDRVWVRATHTGGATARNVLIGEFQLYEIASLATITGTLAVTETGDDIAAFTGEHSAYDADALALFARWTAVGATPSIDDKDRAQARITALKTAGLWSSLQVLQLYDAHAQAAALTNWKNPGVQDATLNNSPTFTANVGFATNGTSSSVSTFNPNGLLTLNSFHVAIWVTDTAQSANSHFGWYDTGGGDGISINCRNTTDQMAVRVAVQDVNSGTVTGITDASGLTVINRSGASAVQVYKNGVAQTVTNATAASVAFNDDALRFGNLVTGGSFSVTHPLFLAAGVSLDATAQASLYSVLNGFRTLATITGTLAVTETGADIAALSGVVPIAATLAVTEVDADAAAFTGIHTAIAGTLAVTETGADVAVFAGLHAPISATLAVTESGLDLATLSGTVKVAGTFAITEVGVDSAALDADVYVTSTLAVTEVGSDTAAAAGAAAIAGMLAASEVGADTAAFSGAVEAVSGRIATLAVTETGTDLVAFTGTVTPFATRTATLAVTEVGPDTAALAGAVAAAATLAATEVGADTAAFTGGIAALPGRVATLAVTETGADTAALAGTLGLTGRFAALAVTESGADVAAATGATHINAALATLESQADVAAMAGQTRISAALAIVEPGLDVASLSISSAIAASMVAIELWPDTAAIVLRTRGVEANIGLSGTLNSPASLRGSVSVTRLQGSRQSGTSLRGSVSLSARLQARRSDQRLRGRV